MSSTPKRDEYEEWCENNKHQVTDMPYGLLAWTKRFADAALAEADERIAELEAALMDKDDDYWRPKLRLLQDDRIAAERRAEQAEADVNGCNKKLVEAEAEVGRLRARRCRNCAHWTRNQPTWGWQHNGSCALDHESDESGIGPSEDFGCVDWAERGGEK